MQSFNVLDHVELLDFNLTAQQSVNVELDHKVWRVGLEKAITTKGKKAILERL